MIAGADYYERRNAEDNPVLVKHKDTGEIGVVTRVTPTGNHIPAQVHVVFGDEVKHSAWVPQSKVVRVS